MKETVAIYKKQRVFIENSLTSMIESIDFDQYDAMKEQSIFTLFHALKATYKINKKYKQSTPLVLVSINRTFWDVYNLEKTISISPMPM